MAQCPFTERQKGAQLIRDSLADRTNYGSFERSIRAQGWDTTPGTCVTYDNYHLAYTVVQTHRNDILAQFGRAASSEGELRAPL